MTLVNDISAKEEHIAMLLEYANRRLRRDLTRVGGSDFPTLRGPHFRILQLIPEGGSRVTDLAERALMTKQALGQLVDHLQAGGYVESRQLPADRRVRLVRRTAKGDAARDAALEIIAVVEDEWRAEVGARRYATTRAVLRELADADVRATMSPEPQADV
jgi:DNA-binding MarR family transcriptional regulator